MPWRSFEIQPDEKLPLELVPAEKLPQQASYWSLQRKNYPPLPFCPFPELPVYYLGNGSSFLVDDRTVDYEAIYKERAQKRQEQLVLAALQVSMGLMSQEEFSLLSGEGLTSMYSAAYASGDLWLEILSFTNHTASLVIHEPVTASFLLEPL